MTIKAVVDSLDGLSPEIAKLYQQGEGGKHYLTVSGLDEHPEIGALRRAKEHEKAARLAAENKAAELSSSLDALTDERDGLLSRAIPREDVERLEGSYKEKLAKREAELTEQIKGLTGNLEKILVDNVAQTIAADLSDHPAILLPHVRGRLRAEMQDGQMTTRVLAADGSPSAHTVDDLKKELLTSDAFAPILRGTRARGGGAAGAPGGGGAPTNKSLSEMTEKERVEWHRKDPEGFREALAAARKM